LDRKRKALAEGITIEPGTTRPIEIPEEDQELEIDGDMLFWVELDQALIGDRGETGYVGIQATEFALDLWGIHTPVNRETARIMLQQIATGRNEGLSEHIEPEKPVKTD
jgi:hypothetical protein